MIKRIVLLVLLLFISIFADTSLLVHFLPYWLRPLLLTSLVLAATAELSLWEALAAAVFGGLSEDMLCSEAVGLTSALLLCCIAILGSILHKNSLKKWILVFLFALLAFAEQAGFSLFAAIYGSSGNVRNFFAAAFVRSVMTALAALLLSEAFNRAKAGRIKRE